MRGAPNEQDGQPVTADASDDRSTDPLEGTQPKLPVPTTPWWPALELGTTETGRVETSMTTRCRPDDEFAHEAPDAPAPDGSTDERAIALRRISTHRRLRRILLACAATVCVGAAILPLVGVATIYWFGRGADEIDITPLARYDPPQTIRVLARDGSLLGEIGGPEHRSLVAFEDVPDHVVSAFLAAEDAEFFRHGPTDPRAIVRATLANAAAGELTQGASTITQQTVKNVLLSHERTLERKSKEILLAARVERELGKAHVLAVYLNEIYLGEGRYGIQAAARHYFGRDVAELDLGQAATLASLPKAPSAMSPYRDPERLRARRDWVLRRMVTEGFATDEDIEPFVGEPLDVLPAGAERSLPVAPEVVDIVAAELREALGERALEHFGGEVRTSLDLDLQRRARAEVESQLDALEKRNGYGNHARRLDERARARVLADAPPSSELEVGTTTTAIVRNTTDDRGLWVDVGETAVLVTIEGWAALDGDARHDRFPAGGRIDVEITAAGGTDASPQAITSAGPEAGAVLIELEGGRVRALVGGRAASRGTFNRATQARRQPGSAFKPFVYGAALASRRVTAASARTGEDQRRMTLREALARSDNLVANQVLETVVAPAASTPGGGPGPAPVVDPDYGPILRFAGRAGIRAPLRKHASLALGTSEVTPWELTDAYATLARGGRHVEPRIIETIRPSFILTPEGIEPKQRPTALDAKLGSTSGSAIDPQVAFVLTQMMTSVVKEGTARSARDLPLPLAGKTGTTDEARDGWFVGYSPRHVAGVWVGFDEPRSLGAHEHGSSTALPIWRNLMAETLASAGAESETPGFLAPPGVVRSVVDRTEGVAACRLDDRWWSAGYCSGGWFFQHCEPAGLHPHPTFARCSDPNAWRSEWFVAGTKPEPHVRTRPHDPGVHVVEVAMFDDALVRDGGPTPASNGHEDARTTARYVEDLRARIEHALVPTWPSLVRGLDSVGAPARLRATLRLDAGGHLRSIRWADPSSPGFVTSALHGSIARAHRAQAPPPEMIDPHSGEAELTIEFVLAPLDVGDGKH